MFQRSHSTTCVHPCRFRSLRYKDCLSRFAFVNGGKDPDEILKTSGESAMRKIIDDAVPLVDFLWEITNKKFLTNTPGGRSQAEKFLKKAS